MSYLTTATYINLSHNDIAREQPIPHIGDRLQLLSCEGSDSHNDSINSIWKVARINGRSIMMVEMNKSGVSGIIDVGGPWSWKILSDDWDD